VGIDLAWKAKARSGLAAVDQTGCLIDSGTAVTDDEIVAWIAEHRPVSVAAVDAPLVAPTRPTDVRESLAGRLAPPSIRVEVRLEFRLGPEQTGRNESDLDNLVKSTIDA
jgi:predicted nuclease with RNAse H fold